MNVKELIDLLSQFDPQTEVMVAPMAHYPSLNDSRPNVIPDPLGQRPVRVVVMSQELVTPERTKIAVIGFEDAARYESPEPDESVH